MPVAVSATCELLAVAAEPCTLQWIGWQQPQLSEAVRPASNDLQGLLLDALCTAITTCN